MNTNTNSKLQALRAALASALTCADSILCDVNGDDAALQSGAAGSGRYYTRSGTKIADLSSEHAQHASRLARRNQTVEAHTQAGDLHQLAAAEFKKVGDRDRANRHTDQATLHYKTAKVLQGADLDASASREDYGFPGRPTVSDPKGSDADANDKNEFDDVRRRNLENSGPFATPDPETGNIKCPLCQHTFGPEESVSGKNSAKIVCPRCSGAFRTETGRAIGTQAEE